GAGIAGSPLTLAVAVGSGDTAATWAAKVRAALAANTAITALYAVGGSGTGITLTAMAAGTNAGTLEIHLDNDTCPGNAAASSSAEPTRVNQVETATPVGTIAQVAYATLFGSGAGIAGSPLTLAVAVGSGDTAATWAAKVRAALAANSAITALYAVGGSD